MRSLRAQGGGRCRSRVRVAPDDDPDQAVNDGNGENDRADGNEALECCDASVELVITDWNMPNMGGLDLVKALRSKPDTENTPILMVTTRSVQEDILEAVQAGVNSYIVKPFTPQILKEKIDEIV